tara:strand:+ start:16857 stop:18281 length:1425 start_codon:yes stop_codon:yes gene_type:complete
MNGLMVEFYHIINNWIFVYAIILMGLYLFLAGSSLLEIRTYMNRNKYMYYDDILRSPLAPGISIIAPAYNESRSIVYNIRSLLSLHYNNYDIIIVNDGSKDDTLQRMIDAYDLVKQDIEPELDLDHNEITGVYKSTNKAFKKLWVVDKKNGGKADALNAGINLSNKELVACVDVDCIIEDDALLKMVKPFLESTEKKMIATGGVVRIANNCEVKDGRMLDIKLPEKLIPLFQTIEYIRAFLLGRMAWSRYNGLLIISGAFGLFDKKILIEAGGYDQSTVGEDMEIVVRMRRLMHNKNIPYEVEYIPDPLCWTEVPEDRASLIRQRNRWTRGTIETLISHRGLFFNAKTGVLGLLSYPFWFFFEWLAPLVEFFGLLYFIFLVSIGFVNWKFFFLLLLFVYTFAILYSSFALLIEEMTFRQYKKSGDLIRLFGVILLEPILYHPITVYAAIRGNFDKFVLKKSNWGSATRQGFSSK